MLPGTFPPLSVPGRTPDTHAGDAPPPLMVAGDGSLPFCSWPPDLSPTAEIKTRHTSSVANHSAPRALFYPRQLGPTCQADVAIHVTAHVSATCAKTSQPY